MTRGRALIVSRLMGAIYEAESPMDVYVRRYAFRAKDSGRFYFHSHRGAHGMDPDAMLTIDRWLLLDAPGSRPCRRCFGREEVARWVQTLDARTVAAGG